MNAAIIVALLALSTVIVERATGQSDEYRVVPPPHYRMLVEMADCKSSSCLLKLRTKLPSGERMTDLVFFSRQMEFQPGTKAADSLLQNMPASVADVTMLTNLSTWHDGATETEHDMAALGKIYARWPRLVTRAVLLRPYGMTNYVRYLKLAPNDMHSDFTGNAEIVCRKKHDAFVTSFRELANDDQAFIEKYVFDPAGCKAIFLSEAD